MKINIITIFAITISVCSLLSCNPSKKFTNELTTIDSCITVIEEMEEHLNGINFDSLDVMVQHVQHNESVIKRLYMSDTVDNDFARMMNECKGLRKTMEGSKAKKIKYGDELNALKHQFMDLKTDIMDGRFSKEQIDGYLSKEKRDMHIVHDSFYEFYDLQLKQTKIYYSNVPVVDKYVQDLLERENESNQ